MSPSLHAHRDKKRGELGPDLSHTAGSRGSEVYGACCGVQPGAAGVLLRSIFGVTWLAVLRGTLRSVLVRSIVGVTWFDV